MLMLTGWQAEDATPFEAIGDFAKVCEGLPREGNAGLPLSEASDDWFQVYAVAEGVYSIVEP